MVVHSERELTLVATRERTCFLISPIGEEGSHARKHADAVFKYIVRPAMEECGIRAVRGDHLDEPGAISKQMFQRILNDDLCVAVLTGQNPNVYYELGVAHASRRPVIILLSKDEDLPFDVRGLRCVNYDLSPTALVSRVYVNQLVAHVRSFEASGWRAESPVDAVRPAAG